MIEILGWSPARFSPAVATLMVFAALPPTAVRAQSAAARRFEAASIKASTSFEDQSLRGGPGTSSPGQFACSRMPLTALIVKAWDLRPWEFANPQKTDSAYYNVTAKIPPNTTRADFNLMLRHLLVQRLGLLTHHEPRDQDGYDLVVAKGGPKMSDAEPAPRNDPGYRPDEVINIAKDKSGKDQIPPGRPMALETGLGGVIRIMGRVQTLADLVNTLQSHLGHPVSDKTGLAGKYDYVLEFAPDIPRVPSASGGSLPSEAASPHPFLPEALAKQLGLELRRTKVAVHVLIVDAFNKTPSEN